MRTLFKDEMAEESGIARALRSKWLNPALVLIPTAWTAITWYADHAADSKAAQMTMTWNVITTLALWVLLVWVAARNLKDIGREKKLRIAMLTLEDEHANALKYACAEKLREFEKRLGGAAFPLLVAGRLHLLAEDAGWLCGELDTLTRENELLSHGFQDLSHPFTKECYPEIPLVRAPFSWQQLHLLLFGERYKKHRLHVMELHLESEISDELEILKVSIPNRMSLVDFRSMMGRYRDKLEDTAGKFEAPYMDVKRPVPARPPSLRLGG
jgi:hypothetical protein